MAANIEVLLAQEMLTFTPLKGAFDVGAVAEGIGAIGFSFRDAADPATFVFSSDAESRDKFEARRKADPESQFPYVPLVEVHPEKIMVWPIINDPPSRELSREILQYFIKKHECGIHNEIDVDMNEVPAPG